MIRIGPAGNSESFTAMGYKSTPQIPEYLEKMGLNAYEYRSEERRVGKECRSRWSPYH